jgi:hypothetical protein
MAEPSRQWKTIGYWCEDCLRKKEEEKEEFS